MCLKVYAWELPGVAGNACNGLTPTVALQLAAVVYGENLFSEPLEDLEGYKFVGKRIYRGGMHGRCICRVVEEEWRPLRSGGWRWSVGEEGRGEVDPNDYGKCIVYLCVAVCWCIKQPWEVVAMEDRRREET
eukprot:Gb_21008 [translate_table: standard]